LSRSIHYASGSASQYTINNLEDEISRGDSVADFHAAGDTCFRESLFLPAKLLYVKTSFVFIVIFFFLL
jgi:hypothetical protein